jgi:hypothetical protein
MNNTLRKIVKATKISELEDIAKEVASYKARPKNLQQINLALTLRVTSITPITKTEIVPPKPKRVRKPKSVEIISPESCKAPAKRVRKKAVAA